MSLSLHPAHLKRYKDLFRLLVRHGGHDLVAHLDLDERMLRDEPTQAEGHPEALAADLEALGPTYVKLGQMLSTRPDLLPEPYLEALRRLQDDVAPFPFEEAAQIIEEELGVRISKAFAELDPAPLAAASLGQVHRGRLRDGRPVVVKVQRPGIRKRILEDLDALGELADFADEHTETGRRYAFGDILDQFRKTILRELDYRQEAHNLTTLAANLAAYRRLLVPQPVPDYVSGRVLTMDYVEGTKITAVSPLARLDLDGSALAEELIKAYLDQVLVDGFFHADPHPGNVFLTDAAPGSGAPRRLALLDLGMVARIDEKRQEQLLKLLLAVSQGHGREVAEMSIEMGKQLPHFDREAFIREIADLVLRFYNAPVEDLEMGRITMEITRLGGRFGLRSAPELTLLGKTLLNLDEIARTLAPDFNPNEAIRRHAHALMQRRMVKQLAPGNVFTTMLEMNEFVQALPRRANTLLDALVNKEFEVRVHAFDEARTMGHFQRMTNRLAISLVLAALIVGAALMMRVETSFTLLGYPGLAMLFFLLAAACGLALVVSIVLSDRRLERQRGPDA